jgi:hypothetical protein
VVRVHSRAAPQIKGAFRADHQRHLEGALQDIRAIERYLSPERGSDPEVLSQPVEEGTEATVPRALRHSREELEGLSQRCEGAGLLERLHEAPTRI